MSRVVEKSNKNLSQIMRSFHLLSVLLYLSMLLCGSANNIHQGSESFLRSSIKSIEPLKWPYTAVVGILATLGAREFYNSINEQDMKDNVVVITGAGSGIGRILAIRLASLGCRVALWDLHGAPLKRVVEEINSSGGDARGYIVDVTNRSRVYKIAKQVLNDFDGHVDILINNAGILPGKQFLQSSDAIMEKTVQVNTIAHFWTIKAFLPGMVQRQRGHLVTIASMAGLLGVPKLVAYSTSKFGAIGTLESLDMELHHFGIHKGIHTTCICPFFIDTGLAEGAKSRFNWLLPILDPEYVAEKIIKGIQRRRKMVLMPRFCYTAPILKACFPNWVFVALMDFFGASSSMDDFIETRNYAT